MKRLMCILIMILLLVGCAQETAKPISMEQVIQAYEQMDYIVWDEAFEATEDGCVGTIEAIHETENTVIFSFFNSPEAAQKYAKDLKNPIHDFVSGILNEPANVTVEVYGNIVLEYYDEAYCAPFRALTGE